MKRVSRRSRHTVGLQGFTLVELLVVIGIIAVLAGLLLPTLGRAQMSAQRVKCMSNARQLIGGLMMYTQDFKGVFPFHKDAVPGPNGAIGGNVGWSTNGLNPFAVEVNPYWKPAMPTYLAEYVNVKPIAPDINNTAVVSPAFAHCPANEEAQFRGNNLQRSSYWYSATMYLNPDDLQFQFDNGGSFAKADHNPVKITWAKRSSKKVLLQELESFHENKRVNAQQALGVPGGSRYKYVCGFADGHVELIEAGAFLETNINITGKTIVATATQRASRHLGVGIRGQDID